MTSRTMSVSIKRDPKTVYEFVFNLENLPKWANATFQSIREQDGEWIVGTPQGSAKVRIIQRNEFGVLDHYVILPSGMEVFVPLRVVKNDTGSEVMLTIFQTLDKSEKKFAEDVDMVDRDLKNLKNIMEEDEKGSTTGR
jgi:hypothetical protein